MFDKNMTWKASNLLIKKGDMNGGHSKGNHFVKLVCKYSK